METKKKIIPVCPKCNKKSKADAIIESSKNVLNDNSIQNELANCKHEKISKALYAYRNVMNVENDFKKMCCFKKHRKNTHCVLP